jgi:hypothetical protein
VSRIKTEWNFFFVHLTFGGSPKVAAVAARNVTHRSSKFFFSDLKVPNMSDRVLALLLMNSSILDLFSDGGS